jgi:oxygen-independent coproporphyrinogen-3 oxidase
MLDSPISLYLHIPFCRHRCAYCDFNTYAGIEEQIPRYVDALCEEVKLSGKSAEMYYAEKVNVHTIFFGGGTPSLLSLDQLHLIMKTISAHFHLLDDAEVTLEANPGTVDQRFLSGLRDAGFNRISLGMQSAHPDDLKLLERQHSLEDVLQSIRWARQAGFDNVNLDLIFGIPQQTLASWQHTLSMALSTLPEHLSLYALTIEHGTPMEKWIGDGLLPEPDSDLAADMYELAMEHLERVGYSQYEISNWRRFDQIGADRSCLHNLQYWRLLPYLGFGAGAHGFAVGYRTANVLSPAAYIQRFLDSDKEMVGFPRTPAVAEMILIDREAEMGEMMMMGLRLVQEGVPESRFLHRFEQSLEQIYHVQIAKLIRDGLLEWIDYAPGERALRLSKRGRLLGNRVFREFI